MATSSTSFSSHPSEKSDFLAATAPNTFSSFLEKPDNHFFLLEFLQQKEYQIKPENTLGRVVLDVHSKACFGVPAVGAGLWAREMNLETVLGLGWFFKTKPSYSEIRAKLEKRGIQLYVCTSPPQTNSEIRKRIYRNLEQAGDKPPQMDFLLFFLAGAASSKIVLRKLEKDESLEIVSRVLEARTKPKTCNVL